MTKRKIKLRRRTRIKEIRNKSIRIRVTTEEKEILVLGAKKAGLALGAFLVRAGMLASGFSPKAPGEKKND